jgi:hypothetical protein
MKFEIKSWMNGSVLFSIETDSWKLAVEAAVKAKADLSSANLSSANLRSANLSSADLSYADLRSADLSSANLSSANLRSANLSSANLRSANLSYANLSYANLSYADLSSANLSYANLRSANLSYANLSYANLSSADLSSANLRSADLRSADLRSANLSYADLSYADLRSADLSSAKNSELAIAMPRILPEGDLIGWKKCNGNKIVKLLIPEKSKRSHAFGRKCRAQFVKVLQVIGGGIAETSAYGQLTKYAKGKTVKADKWDADFCNECSNGIHFFITKEEAEDYQ